MASIRQRGSKWQARIIRKGFPAEVRSFDTKSEAVKWARSIEAQMELGGYQSPARSNDLLLRDLLDRYAQEVTPSKRGAKDELIRIRALQRSRLADFSLATLTPAVLANFRDERLRKVSSATVVRDLSLLSGAINHARREWGVSVSNPCQLIRKPSVPPGRARTLRPDEEGRLIAALAPVGRRSPWMAPLVTMALETAMRRGELLALKWENVQLENRTAYLPMTKNGRPRSVPLSTRAIGVLTGLPRDPSGMVFPITDMAMEAAFRKACKRAGIDNLRFHDLRHTGTTRMAGKLPNAIELAAVTGHQTLQMLKRYYHPSAEALALKLD